MNQAKGARQAAAMAAPKVGSASVVDPDAWLAIAAAAQAAREKSGATGNPFTSAEAVVKEAKRQAVDDDDEFAIEPKRARAEASGADDDGDGGGNADAADAAAAEPSAAADGGAAALSHEEKREIELSIMELEDEMEEEGASAEEIGEKSDMLRKQLLKKAIAAKK